MLAADSTRRFRLGVNYWPARTAMAWWSRFDRRRGRSRLRADRRGRSRLGADLPDLGGVPAGPEHGRSGDARPARQPSPTSRARAGLAIMPTLFTGSHERRQLDPAVGARRVDGERSLPGRLGRQVVDDRAAQLVRGRGGRRGAGAAGGGGRRGARGPRRAVGVGPRQRELELRRSRRTERRRERWLDQITSAIRAADPDGADHDRPAHGGPRGRPQHRPARSRRWCDFLSMHGYPDLRRLGRRPDRRAAASVPRRRHPLARRQGATWSSPSSASRPTAPATLRRGSPAREPLAADRRGRCRGVHRARARRRSRAAGCVGALLWCYTDYEPAIWGSPPLDQAIHERSFGLWRADGSPKPAVEARGGAHRDGTCRSSRRRHLDRHRPDGVLRRSGYPPPPSLPPIQGRQNGNTCAG